MRFDHVGILVDDLEAEQRRLAAHGVRFQGPRLPDELGAPPADAPDLDFLAGMGEGNVEEFGAAFEGREVLAPLLEDEYAGLKEVSPEQLAEALRPFLSDVDAAALTGELAEHLHASMHAGLDDGVEGWIDDDLAFVEPWGFDVGAITVPTLIWQGVQDLMVPGTHGHWLHEHVSGAEGGILDAEGHLTLFVNRVGEVQEWLLERLR